MATDIAMPSLGDGVSEADVLHVLVEAGDDIAKGQTLIEVETDKATVEVPSDASGNVLKVHVKPGDTILGGNPIITINESSSEEAITSRSAQEIDNNASEEAITSRSAQEIDNNASEQVPIDIPNNQMGYSAKPPINTHPHTTVSTQRETPVFASPSIRKLAREFGIDIYQVPGTGPGGRISENDVKLFSRAKQQTGRLSGLPSLPDFSTWGEVEEQPLPRIRKTIANNLSTSWSNIPHVTLNLDTDITDLEKTRQEVKQKFQAKGAKLTITPILVKALADTLSSHPRLNSSIDIANSRLILKKYINIGIATDTEKGLIVPVVKSAADKSLFDICVELSTLAAEARTGSIGPEFLVAGTFTISNLGGLGTTHFTPIVNFPEVGILGVGRAMQKPEYIGESLSPRLHLPLSLSFDHRAVDGADGAKFLQDLGDTLANMSLHLPK